MLMLVQMFLSSLEAQTKDPCKSDCFAKWDACMSGCPDPKCGTYCNNNRISCDNGCGKRKRFLIFQRMLRLRNKVATASQDLQQRPEQNIENY